MDKLAPLAQLIVAVASVAQLARGGYAMYKGEKGVSQDLVIGLTVLGIALMIVLEIMSGAQGGLVAAVYKALTGIVNTVASSFAG